MTFRLGITLTLLIILQTANAQVVDIHSVEINGNKATKPAVILRELLIKPSHQYDKNDLEYLTDQSKNRLLNLNLFNAVDVHIKHSDSTILVVDVVEKWYIWPIPFIEFSDRNFNVWSDLDFDPNRTNFGLYLFTYNLWGMNHTLKTSFVQGYNETYGIEYRIPFIFPDKNWGLALDVHHRSQAEMWLRTEDDKLQFYHIEDNENNTALINQTNAYLLISNRFRDFDHLNFGLKYQNTSLDTAILSEDSDYLLGLQDLSVFSASVGLTHDKRNNKFFPTQGVYLAPEITLQQFAFDKATYNGKLSIHAQHFGELKKDWFSSFSILAEYNTSDTLPYEYTRRLGYSNSMRGFEKRVIDGNSTRLAQASIRRRIVNKPNLPLKFIPFKNYNFLPLNVYLGAFAEGGYIGNRNVKVSNELPNTFLYSGGISLQTLFYNDRVLRLEYSLNSLKESGFFVHFKKAI